MQDKYILCPKCGKTLSATREACVYCGAVIQQEFKYTGPSLTDLIENALKELTHRGYDNHNYPSHMDYKFTLTHDGLNKHRLFKGKDLHELYQKALMQAKTWDKMWAEKQAKEAQKQDIEMKRLEVENKIQEFNKKYGTSFNNLVNILTDAINNNYIYDWNNLKDFSQFDKLEPTKPIRIKPNIPDPLYPKKPQLPIFSKGPRAPSFFKEPQIDAPKYQVKMNIFYKVFKWIYKKRKKAALKKYQKHLESWQIDKSEKEKAYIEEKEKWQKDNNPKLIEYQEDVQQWVRIKEGIDREYKIKIETLEKSYSDKFNKDYAIYERNRIKWQTEHDIFYQKQNDFNNALDNIMDLYNDGEKGAIIEYYKNALNNSNYPFSFIKYFEIDLLEDSKILIINYLLPIIDNIPNVKQLKYIKSKDEFHKIYLKSDEHNKIYDDVLYMISLRTIYEIFYGDKIGAIDSVVFNGWIKITDKSTGQAVQKCILSIQAKKDDFLEINLSKIDPKSCFIHLKGVSASKLYDLIPIAPIMDMDKEDKRFISSYDVAASLDESINIAAMDWQDFEHLIREIFEKEFQKSGGEVKITRASRDAGVDAIAFDPDPIRGGKIVIQAKRYVNIVGVAAVRDLYGTLINEGAIKGILVTTSNYGPDAHEFATGKPITLLNGSHLLHLLEKHGYRAKIDLVEAKQLLME